MRLIRARRDQVAPGEKPEEKEKWIHLAFTWSGKNFTLDIAESDRSVCSACPHRPPRTVGTSAEVGTVVLRVFDLKVALRELTTVPEERQKVLGLVRGKLPPDQERMYVQYLHVPWMYQDPVLGSKMLITWAQRGPQSHQREEVHAGWNTSRARNQRSQW